MTDVHYSYLVNLKLVAGGHLRLMQDTYPGATDLSLASRDFGDYNECITSCKKLMDDVLTKLNSTENGITYMLNSEVNPLHTGQETLSKDWAPGELARIWAFDKQMDKKDQPIVAVGQARIFKTESSTYRLGRS